MREIPLTKGKIAIVDNEDFEWLNQWKWTLSSPGGYAFRSEKNKSIFMHRLINNTPKGLETDHINKNKLDNRRCNLRSVTHSQNKMNIGVRKNNLLGVKGVVVETKGRRKKYRARIWRNYKQIHLGHFNNLEDAIFARKEAEKVYFILPS